MKTDRNTKAPSPEGVTNRPRDLRLVAMSGTIRQAKREQSPTWLLVLGVLLGILMCMALSLWREAERAASERHGQLPAANSTGAASANLIAAAPDLYVALEDLADIIETLCKWLDVAHGLAGGAIEGAYREACAGSLDRAATALAKARGEEVAR